MIDIGWGKQGLCLRLYISEIHSKISSKLDFVALQIFSVQNFIIFIKVCTNIMKYNSLYCQEYSLV